jgi:hypothetical protein
MTTTDTFFCKACGEPLAADSKFCEHCGVEQERRDDQSKLSFSKLVEEARGLERVEAIAPGAAEMASQIATQLRTPTVAMSLAAGALAAVGMFGIGLVFGLILSDRSALGFVDQGKGVIGAGFAQMLNFLQIGYGDGVGKLGPALFVVFPIGACAVAAATQARRTLGLAPLTRLFSGAGVGLVFGLLMLVPALGAGGLGGAQSTIEPNALSAVVLGALWGAVGGLLGTYYIVRTALKPGWLSASVPAPLHFAGRAAYLALRPLALLLVLMTVAGTLFWTVETLLTPNLRSGSSTPVATIDHAAYAVEHGVHWTELAGLSQFRMTGEGGSSGVPVPTGDTTKIRVGPTGDYRLFAFSRAMPIYTFAPLLIFLLASALLLAFSAGSAVAQSRHPDTPWIAAAWGSLVGPTWALAMVVLNAFVSNDFFGRANGGSVFGVFLLGGLSVGALGGFVSLQTQRRRVSDISALGVEVGGGSSGSGLP